MRSKISENIGFDDQTNTFFCLRCGKAGYSRMPQVRGHLSQCIGTQRRKGIPVPNRAPANHLQPLGSTWQPLTGPFSGDGQVPSYPLEHQHLAPGATYLQDQQLASRVEQLENHLDHVVDARNPAPGQDWISKYKGWLIVIGVVVVAVVIKSSKHEQVCPTVCGTPGPGSGKKEQPGIAEKALSKVADRLVIKGVDSIFKAA